MNPCLWAVVRRQDKTAALVLVTDRGKSFDGIHFHLVRGAVVIEWTLSATKDCGQKSAVLRPGCGGPVFGRGYYVSCVEHPPKEPKSVPRL